MIPGRKGNGEGQRGQRDGQRRKWYLEQTWILKILRSKERAGRAADMVIKEKDEEREEEETNAETTYLLGDLEESFSRLVVRNRLKIICTLNVSIINYRIIMISMVKTLQVLDQRLFGVIVKPIPHSF